MLDPLTALGLASNIVQFVTFSADVLRVAREINTSGGTAENRSLQFVTNEMKRLTLTLSSPTSTQQGDDETGLCGLADTCKTLADQILDILEKIKPRDPNSRFQSVCSAMKNKFYEKKKADLEKTLDRCRGQLGFQIDLLMRSDIKARLDSLVKSAVDDAIKLEQIESKVSQLRQGVVVTSVSTEGQLQLQKLLDISDHASNSITQVRILRSLAFSDMHGRFDAVDIAHYKTFEWIFEETKNEDNPYDRSAGVSFIHWLSSGSGIFHISGKLGSGKSTLMKFLCYHPRTEAELRTWAGSRELVFAKFFFWKPGSVLQRSLNGLFRSLIHDTLQACPELIPVVLPQLWARVKLIPWHTQPEIHLRNEEIRDAFNQLIQYRSLHVKHCFCFFIDGLDEYEQTRQEDYRSMVELLGSWADRAPEDVKICVSSREYNVFLNSFSEERRLCLQDLTRGDMEQYVRDKLSNVCDEAEETRLVETIVTKANGIFLWVALVVRSLRERINDGYEMSAIEKELGSLPEELEELFEHILKSMDKFARTRAYQTCAMILTAQPYHFAVSLSSYYFLEEYQSDPMFAQRALFGERVRNDISPGDRLEKARRRLNGCSKGLCEVSVHKELEFIIAFTHRSVPDFLEKPRIQSDMDSYLNDFNSEDAICQLFLADMRSTEKKNLGPRLLSLHLFAINNLLIEAGTDSVPYCFRERLDSAVARFTGMDEENRRDLSETIYYGPFTSYAIRAVGHSVSFLQISAVIGDHRYIAWKVQQDPTTIDNDWKTLRLLTYISVGAIVDHNPGCFKLLQFFLHRGLSPQTRFPGNVLNDLNMATDLSFWESFILYATTSYIPGPHTPSFRTQVPRIQNIRAAGEKMFANTIEKFLKYGADPHIWISIPEGALDPEPDLVMERSIFMSYKSFVMTVGKERREISAKGMFYELFMFIKRKNWHASLGDLIEYWGVDKNNSLRKLIYRRIEEEQERE